MGNLVKDYEKALENMIKVYGIKGDREDLTVEVILNANHTGEPQVVRGEEGFVNNLVNVLSKDKDYRDYFSVELENLNIIL
ncbi:hypothetical protein HOS99_gp148 [Staphylococcus phage phiSA_BS1]|uniref:Uncharacterized protein n=1 Tax=Staphylococcus phage phiSA_BS1 TaxID=2126734 RepID=A0A2P1MXT9_9CAUD|nr:hypothetical protein HOS99_gp148 [Staphylococcus phage phiSA_BS1]AVP40389.1 hypothetical protein [Staphylococcus phage phiSA_BS1]